MTSEIFFTVNLSFVCVLLILMLMGMNRAWVRVKITRDRIERCEGKNSCRKGKLLHSLKMVER